MSPRMRVLKRFRVLAYELSFDNVNKLCELSALSAHECFLLFKKDFVNFFERK